MKNFIWNWGRFLKYNNYIDGGIIEEVKENILIQNKSFKEILNLPDIFQEKNNKIKNLI